MVGEIRGAEAADLLQALNTGHGGSLTTIHANNATSALDRLASCAMQARDLPWDAICRNIVNGISLVAPHEPGRRPARRRRSPLSHGLAQRRQHLAQPTPSPIPAIRARGPQIWPETPNFVAPGASKRLLTRTNTRPKPHSAAPILGSPPFRIRTPVNRRRRRMTTVAGRRSLSSARGSGAGPLTPAPESSGCALRTRSADLVEYLEDRATHTYATMAPDKPSTPAA